MEVDDKTQTHRLYRDLVCGSSAYGAERWIATLQRMCERLAFATAETVPTRELGGGKPYPFLSFFCLIVLLIIVIKPLSLL